MTNREFLKTDEVFKLACDVAGVTATKRQASKFRNQKGQAFAKVGEANAMIEAEKKPEAPATIDAGGVTPEQQAQDLRDAVALVSAIEPDMVQS